MNHIYSQIWTTGGGGGEAEKRRKKDRGKEKRIGEKCEKQEKKDGQI